MRYSLFIIVVLVICISCKKENMCDCIKSTGKTKTTTRNIANFKCIYLQDKINLYLSQGSNYDVKVEAGANLQSLIKTELDGETLKVFNNNRCNWVRGYKHSINVYVTAPYFKHIKHAGLGTINNGDVITQDEITLRVENSGDLKLNLNMGKIICSSHGNGDTYLSGVTNNLESDYTGTNFLYAKDLNIVNYVYLHSVSLGNAYIKAPENGLMDIVLDRKGNVYYYGNPSVINLKKNSEGNLINN